MIDKGLHNFCFKTLKGMQAEGRKNRHFKIEYVMWNTAQSIITTDSSCFLFFSGMSVLTLALCDRLSWLLVSV